MATADTADSDYYTAVEKLLLFVPCIKQRSFPRRNLFAGPYVGEFGWELMQWQGFVRRRRRYYDAVHVLTYPGRDYLYDGCHVHHHDIDLKIAGYRYGVLDRDKGREMVRKKAVEIGLKDYDIFSTSLLCTRYHKAIWKQDFRLLEEPSLSATVYDIVFHFRAVRKKGSDIYKDYSPGAADELVQRCLGRGISVACIGHPEYSYCPPGCDDYRNVDLRTTVAARAVCGKNSGPMHLASLCGKPTIQWAEDQWRLDFSLKWNPFRVPIYIVSNDESQPAPKSLCNTISDALVDLRNKSNNFKTPLYTLPAQQIAGY
jgi:hypothetical protein